MYSLSKPAVCLICRKVSSQVLGESLTLIFNYILDVMRLLQTLTFTRLTYKLMVMDGCVGLDSTQTKFETIISIKLHQATVGVVLLQTCKTCSLDCVSRIKQIFYKTENN